MITVSPNPTPTQNERMPVVFDMWVRRFERACRVACKPEMSVTQPRRWNPRDDCWHQWCQREDFYFALPFLLRQEESAFLADNQHGAAQASRQPLGPGARHPPMTRTKMHPTTAWKHEGMRQRGQLASPPAPLSSAAASNRGPA